MSSVVPARRLEGTEKNIWVELAGLATKYQMVNLGMGFPDFSPPAALKEAFVRAISDEDSSLNQYTRAFGHPPLVKNLAQFFGKLLGRDLDPLSNVLVTLGAYQALFYAFQALVDEGDEVILIEPFFNCYDPMVRMAGGTPVYIPLRPSSPEGHKPASGTYWRLDPAELSAKFTKRTKAIVLNTPNNPLGKVFTRKELQLIADLCTKHNALCFSDEVYEWLVYDGRTHIRIATLPGMWERTLTIGSAGKTFCATGWKVGWVMGPDHLLTHLRTVHQNSIYHCPTAAQEAVAYGFKLEMERFGQPESFFVQLRQELQEKRDRMLQCLTAVGMRPIAPEGSYFILADISDFKAEVPAPEDCDEPYDHFFVKWMMQKKGLATIPLSIFCGKDHKELFGNFIRFCFVKKDETLDAAEGILRSWRGTSNSQ